MSKGKAFPCWRKTCNLIGIDRDGALEEKWKSCASGTIISIPTGWNGKSEVPPFVPENFYLNRACHLHFNQLNRKF